MDELIGIVLKFLAYLVLLGIVIGLLFAGSVWWMVR